MKKTDEKKLHPAFTSKIRSPIFRLTVLPFRPKY